jgi:hypothetical protein
MFNFYFFVAYYLIFNDYFDNFCSVGRSGDPGSSTPCPWETKVVPKKIPLPMTPMLTWQKFGMVAPVGVGEIQTWPDYFDPFL